MSITIRPQIPADYPAIAALEQQVLGFSISPEDVAKQASGPTFAAMVAERGGQILGSASTGFMAQHTPTGDLRCLVLVDPAARRQGVGAALWEGMQPIFRERRPNHLRANGNGADPDSVAWAERRGFHQAHRLLFQALPLSEFDEAPWHDRMESARARGFCFVPYARLRSPEADLKLHTLYHACLADTPDYTEGDYRPFDSWSTWAFGTQGAWPEGWLVLLAPDGAWAGFTFMQKTAEGAHIFMTGLDGAYRGQGLAIPLKVAAALHARENGVARLTTLNHSANDRIVAVNRALGYQITEDVIRLVKRCEW